MVRASSRASLTVSPLTAVMTPGYDTGLRRRAVRLRFRNQCAFRLLQAEAVGDVGGDGLDLDADPAAADRALVLELGDDILHGRGRDRERDPTLPPDGE